MNLIQNIIENFTFLGEDFIGFSLSPAGIGNFLLHIIVAGAVFIVFYLLGNKLSKMLLKKNKKYNFFINIALGYIAIGTGIGVLGLLSLLKPQVILTFLTTVVLVSLYPFSLPNRGKYRISLDGKNLATWGVVLFILIAFLRLAIPVATEDGYHTDLPILYLSSGTTIHETRDLQHVIPYPQLAEMIYLIPIFLGDKEAVRFIHFGFYLLIVFLLFSISKSKESRFAKFAPLLFVSAPIVIRHTSSSNIDFLMIFCFLLSIVILSKGTSKRELALSGIILGGAMATKLWILAYIPAVIIYIAILNRQLKIKNLVRLFSLFVLLALSVPMIWYLRDYLITGNPIYPIFSKLENLESADVIGSPPTAYFQFNWKMFDYTNIVVFSPLFFIGLILCLFNYKSVTKMIKNSQIVIFFLVLFTEQLFTSIYLGRHLLALYVIAIIVASAGIFVVVDKNSLPRYGITIIFITLFAYYFLNTLFTLPYGLGWADKNVYLTRVLSRDNASYYNFDKLFDKWISDKDIVATYAIFNFYYADFKYVDIGYIFSKDKRSLDLLKERKITRLLIKGGDIEWLCKKLTLKDCNKDRVKILATYPSDTKKYNLYSIEK